MEPAGNNHKSTSPVLRLWRMYVRALSTDPIKTKALTSAALNILSSIVAQKVVKRCEQLDWSKLAKFATVGLVTSPIGHFWFQTLDKVFAGAKGKFVPLQKLVMDQLIFAPGINVVFFSVMAILDGEVRRIPKHLRYDLLPTLKMSWRVWPLTQYFNFNFIPPKFRVLFSNFVGFCWGIYLSIIA